MRQVLHIFAKDSRRFWPEILISLAITVAFVRVYPVQWMGSGVRFAGGFSRYDEVRILANVLTGLVPVTWWLLIARVIHAESLVGDRQFWVTRPYVWWKLLAAKVLFLIAYLYVPFYLAQSALLAEAGFHPLAYVPGLLYNLLLTTGILVVPLVAIAAVTKNFARMVLTILGIVAVIALIAYLSSLSDSNSVVTPYGDRISIPTTLLAGGCVIALQYAVRKVWLARGLLIAIPSLVALVAVCVPDSATMAAGYPRPTGVQVEPIHIAFDVNTTNSMSTLDDEKNREVGFGLPVVVSGLGNGYAAKIDDVIFSLESATGERWNSPWRAVYNHEFLPGTWRSSVNLMISRAAYEKFKSVPVTLHVTFAVTQMRAGKMTQITVPTHDFSVPDFGICPPGDFGRFATGNLECRVALREPQFTYVSAVESVGDCDSSRSEPEAGEVAGDWFGALNPDPAEFGITPVWSRLIYFAHTDNRIQYSLCPGARLTFTQYETARRTQADLAVTNSHLPPIDNHPFGIQLLR